MTYILTRWEVEDFIDEVSTRPRMWVGKDKLWVRREHDSNLFAVKFVNGLPDDMFTMYVSNLNSEFSQEAAQRYSRWLLDKFTSYGRRMEIVTLLRSDVTEERAKVLARLICAPVVRLGEPELLPVHGETVEEPQVIAPEPPPVRVLFPQPRKSKFMQKLLGKK